MLLRLLVGRASSRRDVRLAGDRLHRIPHCHPVDGVDKGGRHLCGLLLVDRLLD